MKLSNRFFLLAVLCGLNSGIIAQISFSNRTDLLLSGKHFSGVAIGVTDMNGDGYDDIVRLDQTFRLQLEYQSAANHPFRYKPVMELTDNYLWAMCIADIDNNGFPDIFTGGAYDETSMLRANATGTEYALEIVNNPPTYAQGMNLADINNDGWIDAFICHDEGTSRVDTNNQAGSLFFHPNRINLNTSPPTDNSGNYGSVWSDIDNDGDLDLYISKCSQLITDSTDGRRINQVFLNDGQGHYIQDTLNNSGLRIGAQSWTADFGDIDNDGDFDCFLTNHDVSSQLLENDGAGHFTDITAQSGLLDNVTGVVIQGIFRDFDNDGFLDILVAGTEHHLFRNNGNRSFSRIDILDQHPMESFAVGDLNRDGFPDIYAGYAELFNDPGTVPDALWLNNGNGNHFFGLILHGVQSNRSAVGTKIRLYSPSGEQVREVRSGESYGIMNSLNPVFGLGLSTQIDSVVVFWPSGKVDKLVKPAADQYLTLSEGGCAIPKVELTASGNTVFCSGDSVTITAPQGFTYRWNTNATTPAITVGTSGNYVATVTAPAGCTAASSIVSVVVDPVEIPAITASGDTIFCAGDAVQLTTSPANAYIWSTGDTTASILATKSGTYQVTALGTCQSFASAPVLVTALQPGLPAVSPDTVALHAQAVLSAVGDSLQWFAAATWGTAIATGPVFQTPPLAQSSTFWVSNIREFDQPNEFTGMPVHIGSNFANDLTNAALLFDCITPFRLARVTVYTDKAGERKIDLRKPDGSTVQSKTVNIPAGTTTIDLNFDVPTGDNLMLTTDSVVNIQVLGTRSPRLRRSDAGVAYPYSIPGYVTIKNSNLGLERYYYFYNWEIDFYSRWCESERVPVTAVVDSTMVGLEEPVTNTAVRVYPNPAADQVWLHWTTFPGGELRLSIFDARGTALFTAQEEFPAGPLTWPIKPEKHPAGIYWLRLDSSGKTIYRKVYFQER